MTLLFIMSSPETAQSTGMLIHGRHLQSIQWERMMWGTPETGRMGTVPTAVYNILEEGPEQFGALAMGTGASRREDGTLEAEATHELLTERFDELAEFALIGEHPRWESSKGLLEVLIDDAVVDVWSKNTRYEVAHAAVIFNDLGINRVIQVTARDHAPRCQVVQGEAREAGLIPLSQRWLLVADSVPYLGGLAGGPVVLEQPHRGDDETLTKWDPGLWPANFMNAFFDLPRDRRHITAMMMRDIITRMRGMDAASFAELNEQFGDV